MVVLRGEPRDYAARHPGPSDVVLVVEVADDSLKRDRKKQRIYARAGIGVYWIVNLRARIVEVYTLPGPGGYAGRHDVAADGEIDLRIRADVSRVAVAALLP